MNLQQPMSLGHLIVIIVLSNHWQPEINGGGGDERIGEFDGALYAGATTVDNESSPGAHD